jgi:hypothetical protein
MIIAQRKDFVMNPIMSWLVLIGVSLATTIPTSAAPLYSAVVPVKPATSVVHVAKKKPVQKRNNRGNYNASQGYIPGHVLTPYGYGDCIGWWERHPDGRMQCHGQLILNHWRD